MQWNTSSEQRQEVRTFWTGPALSYYEVLSLKSLAATGARVIAYSYERDLNIPDGVELADASEILSGPIHEFRRANGDTSLALHSDLFRYIALQRFGGWYADLDIVCLTDRLPAAKTYCAFMANDLINSAILKFPARSAMMQTLVEQSWETLPQAGMATTDEARVSVGPTLFKRMIHEQAMDHLVLPRSKAYEIGRDEILAFFDPARCEATTARLADSDFTHLWNEEWRTLRIPKTLGPPKGSFLDAQFQRFDIEVPERARLAPQAIEAWIREHRLLTDIKSTLGVERVGSSTLDHFAQSIAAFGWEPHGQVHDHPHTGQPQPESPTHVQAHHPQTLRTFWHGDAIGPYQLLCLKSFADRGHRVEVYTYNLKLIVPEWIAIRDAAAILPDDEILRPLPEDGGIAIHANLFRYALLEQLGGWWIDPDVMLMKPELPDADVFFAGRDAFGQVSTAVLKFPAGHALMSVAARQARAVTDNLSEWERSGAGLLTGLIEQSGLESGRAVETLGPVSWFTVLDLFDPSKAGALAEKTTVDRFLRLHDEVWRRAGIHPGLAPPSGSFLDMLLARHDVAIRFAGRMHFEHVRRWLAHMYKSFQLDRSSVAIL